MNSEFSLLPIPGIVPRLAWATVVLCCLFALPARAEETRRPNILFAMADDWSWPHAGAYGDAVVKTPAFDRVADEGVLFRQAFAAAPQCSPNRASILTGRPIWRNEEAGTHGSGFPSKFPVFTDSLEEAGYVIGYTGKPWGPGNWRDYGWSRNPAGPEFETVILDESPYAGSSDVDYAGNFELFLQQKNADQPFFFWYGCHEPHRRYEKGIGQDKDHDKIAVPAFLPDHPEIRSDIADYYTEVEWFDTHLGKMLDLLEKMGELDNTLVVVTSDNGMPFPRAKANLYEYGVHMPLAVRWPARAKGGRSIEDLVSFIDYGPTFLEAAGLTALPSMTGRSFLGSLTAEGEGNVDPSRTFALVGRERHTHARPDNMGYPARAIRTDRYLYIRNFEPDRWPAGDPLGEEGYYDIDGCPSKTFLIENRENPEYKTYFDWAMAKRPAEELFDIRADPACVRNLAGDPDFEAVRKKLSENLTLLLTAQKDPRVVGPYGVFDSYPRFSGMREFMGGFTRRGEYNPAFQ